MFFRPDRSTTLAIIEAIEEITNAIEPKKYAVRIFTDIKKAFDAINHDILIRKVERYGIRGIVLDWIESYLQRKQQFNFVVCSTCWDIVCGVSQGSVLGLKPLYYIHQ